MVDRHLPAPELCGHSEALQLICSARDLYAWLCDLYARLLDLYARPRDLSAQLRDLSTWLRDLSGFTAETTLPGLRGH